MKKITFMVLLLLTFISKGYAQFPQGFEGATFPPTGWATFIGQNGLGTVQNWKSTTTAAFVASGTKAAFVRYENSGGVNEDWMVTPQFTVTAPYTILAFYEAQQIPTFDYGTSYTIRVSTTSQTNIASFAIVDTKTEADIPGTMTQRGIDLSAYTGQSIYVAFVMTQNDGDSWAIDDVSLQPNVSVPNCATLVAPADGTTNLTVGPLHTFSWTAPTTGDAPTSYDVYVGTAFPLTAADFVSNVTTTSIDLTIPAYGTTYYWQVVPKNLAGAATGCATFSFTTDAVSGTACLNAPYGQYPTTTFTTSVCDGATAEDIVTDGYAGEYSLVNVTNGLTYQFTSSNAADFITISNADATTVLAYDATGSATWTANYTGVVRFYTHLDDQCGDEAVSRTRSVTCSGLSISVPDCATMTFPADGAIEVEVGPLVTFTWDAPTTGDAPDSYDFYGGTALPLTAANLIGNYTTTSASLTIQNFNTTFYWLVVPKNLAGDAIGCEAFSFTTQAPPGYCLNTIPGSEAPYPTATFVSTFCDGLTMESVTPLDNAWAGEYSNVAVTAGNTYEFSSSIDTDFITISADDGNSAVAYGTTPISWVAAADGVVRFYTHLDDQCGTEQVDRTRSLICSSPLGIPSFGLGNVKVYPNPTKEVLNITAEKTISNVIITNLLGQQVKAILMNGTQTQINVSDLSAGTYFAKLTSDDQVKTVKFIKE